jgi:ABC-type nitrate/sulfonate/bicarbonate transport system substrate-binding protein
MSSAQSFSPWVLLAAVGLAACGGAAAPASPSAPATVTVSAPASAGASAAVSPAAKPVASATAGVAAKPSGASAAVSVAAKPSGATRMTGGDPNGYPIRIGYASPAVASWPFYAAFAAGLFEQQHVKVMMIQMPPNVAITALSKGEIDFTNSPSNAIEGGTRGLPFKMVLSSWDRTPWTITGKSEFKSVKDLKGKLVGTNQAGSSPYLYLQAALKREGMAMSDIQVVSSPGTQDTFTLLLAGKLDAAVVSPPFDAQAEEKGFHEVAFIGDALQQPYIGLGTNTAFIDQHRQPLVSTIRALMDGNKWLKGHPSEAADLIVKNLGVAPEVAKRSTEKMLPLLGESGELPIAGVQEAIAIQSELTHTSLAVKPEDLVDWSPLHEALGKS